MIAADIAWLCASCRFSGLPGPQKSDGLLADRFPPNKGTVGLFDVSPGTEIEVIQNAELPDSGSFVDVDILNDGLSLLLILGHDQIFHIPMHCKDVGREIPEGSADLKWMFVKLFGFMPQTVCLEPGRRSEERHEYQNRAHADFKLCANRQIFQFHCFTSLLTFPVDRTEINNPAEVTLICHGRRLCLPKDQIPLPGERMVQLLKDCSLIFGIEID